MSSDLATRTNHRLVPDVRRVVAKLFVPGEETVAAPRGPSPSWPASSPCKGR